MVRWVVFGNGDSIFYMTTCLSVTVRKVSVHMIEKGCEQLLVRGSAKGVVKSGVKASCCNCDWCVLPVD